MMKRVQVQHLILACVLTLTLFTIDSQAKTLFDVSRGTNIHPFLEVLASGADPKQRNIDERTPLHVAAAWGTPAMCRALIQAGAEVDVRNKNGFTPLYEASKQGRTGNMAILIKAGADINAKGDYQRTPLHEAAKGHRTLEALRLLLQHAPELNPRDQSGATPLLYAARADSSRIALLLSAGADPNIGNKYGTTALHIATGANRVEIIKRLLDKGADPHAIGEFGSSLEIATRNGYSEAAKILVEQDANTIKQVGTSKAAQPLKKLQNYGFDSDQGDKLGKRLLALCAKKDNISKILLLLEAKANPNLTDKDGRTALFFAAQHNREELVKVLLKHSADPNLGGRHSFPLYIAASSGHYGVAKALIQGGANVDQEYQMNGSTSLQASIGREGNPVLPLLIKSGADINKKGKLQMSPISIAASRGNLEALLLLQEHGADINAIGRNNNTPLHVAVIKRHISITKYLIENGAKLEAKDQYGRTALHRAAHSGPADIVKLLIINNANIEATNRMGRTPIFEAASQNNASAVDLLIKTGAKINANDSSQTTPMHVASHTGNLESCKLLYSAGADINAKSKHGYTPLDLAKQISKNKHFGTPQKKESIVKTIAFLETNGAY